MNRRHLLACQCSTSKQDKHRETKDIWPPGHRGLAKHFMFVLAVVAMGLHGCLHLYAQSGSVVTTTFQSPALEGNLLGDPSTRSALVYLPPSYESSTKRYPVVYLLHGTGSPESTANAARVVENADMLIRDRMAEELIIVAVDGTAESYGWGLYTNSELQGNHADYIADDLVAHIDATYRTAANRDSRGIVGYSLGGMGALKFSMQRADVFGATYAVNSGPLCFSRLDCSFQIGEEFSPGHAEDAERLGQITSQDQVSNDFYVSIAAAYSPNLDNPPLFVDFPFTLSPEAETIADVRDKWLEHDLIETLPEHAAALSSLRGLKIVVGDDDGLTRPENEAFHAALDEAAVAHEFQTYPGGHLDGWSEQFQEAAKYFSETLIIPEPRLGCDLNIDGMCDGQDLTGQTLFQVNLVNGSRRTSHLRRFDINDDGTVDMADLSTWLTDAATANGYEVPYVPGDSNLDGDVDFDDFLTLSRNFASSSRDWGEGNFDGDRDVDFADFLALSGHFGSSIAATRTLTVPEPSTTFLAIAGCFGLLIHRRTARHATTQLPSEK